MIRNIQVLRGMAALFVVFVHIADLRLIGDAPAFGRGGVDLFFVISGFIMVHIDRTKHESATRFAVQRFARVAPFYYLMTLLVLTVALLRPNLLSATTESVPDLLRSLLFIPYQKANGLVQPVLFVGWTLNYEMFFYAVFAVSLFFHSPWVRLAVLCGSLLSLVAAGLAFHPMSPIAGFYTAPLILEFMFGVVLAEGLNRWSFVPVGIAAKLALSAVAGMAMIALFALPVWWHAGSILAPAALGVGIVGAVVCLERGGWRSRNLIALALGEASYAIYLTHPFVVGAVAHFVRAEPPSASKAVAVGSVALALAAAAGWLSHKLVERPLSIAVLSLMTRGSEPKILRMLAQKT